MDLDFKNINGYVYIVANNREIIECTVVKKSAGFVTLKFRNGGGIRLRENRVYGSEIEAKEALRQAKEGR